MKRISFDKQSILLKQNKRIFHTADLALLWGLENSKTTWVTVSRYIRKGTLYPIQKGLYSTLPVSELDPYDLGSSVLHSYCYVSLETILARNGIISQTIIPITYVSSTSRRISLSGLIYQSRQMSDRFLFSDVDIQKVDRHLEASPERAVADMLYYEPSYHFDAENLINWKRVRKIQEKVGYK